jgi:hypothetical protein
MENGNHMNIDIQSLSYDQLLELNHIIIERLKFLDSMNTHQKMIRFLPGDEVSFDSPNQGRQTGRIAKLNKKTVSVITKAGRKWNVSPHLLNKVLKPKLSSKKATKIVGIKR